MWLYPVSRADHPGRHVLTTRAQRERHVLTTYGVGASALALLEAFQAGPDGITRCWGCRRATGAARALAMDHNHRTGEVRMLLCSVCNRIVVGRQFRDDPVALIRLGLALLQPPSRAAWTAAGQCEPGWTPTDPDLLDWLDNRGQQGA